MSRGAERLDASTAAQQVVSLRRWCGHDVIRVDVDAAQPAGTCGGPAMSAATFSTV
jgi:hypothetical protein